MPFMRAVGNGHQRPTHATVRETNGEYVIELDVADFTEGELAVEALGAGETKVFFNHGMLEIHVPRTRLEPRRLPIERPSCRPNPNAVPC